MKYLLLSVRITFITGILTLMPWMTPAQYPGNVNAPTAWFHAGAGITSTPVERWNNLANNAALPYIERMQPGYGHTPGLIDLITNESFLYNFHPYLRFHSSGFARENAAINEIVSVNQGSLFAVGHYADQIFIITDLNEDNNSYCGGGRCGTGFRTGNSQFTGSANNYNPAYTVNTFEKANIFGMRSGMSPDLHENTVNGFRTINTAVRALPPGAKRIGIGTFPGFAYGSFIAEAIGYSEQLTPEEFSRVESYLAIKYGITLGNNAHPAAYLASDNSVVWPASPHFQNHITALGRDDNSALLQKQSKSVAEGTFLSLYLGNTSGPFPAMNSVNTSIFPADRQYFIIGDNNGDTTLNTCGDNAYVSRMTRTWQVKRTTNFTGPVTFAISDVPGNQNITRLLTSGDSTFPDAGTTIHYLTAANGYRIIAADLPDNSYFTFASDSLSLTEISASNPVCTDSSIILTAQVSSDASVHWSHAGGYTSARPSDTIHHAAQQHTGRYHARITRFGCALDTFTDVSLMTPVPGTLTFDTTFCGDTVTITLHTQDPITEYLWSTGETDSFIRVAANGQYHVRYSTATCHGRDTADITLQLRALTPALGPDTTICSTSLPYLLRLTDFDSRMHYTWNTGHTDSAIEINASGTYWVEERTGTCIGTDTIHIRISEPAEVALGTDTTICAGEQITIGRAVSGADYTWQDGSTGSHITVEESGIYYLHLHREGCYTADTIMITVQDVAPDLGPDRMICPGEQIVLTPQPLPIRHTTVWSTGAEANEITVTAAGTYIATVLSDEGCAGSDTVIISAGLQPYIGLGADTVICTETPLQLRVTQENLDILYWNDGSGEPVREIRQEGVYIVYGENACGLAADTIVIRNISCGVMIPDAFTPNGDGLNDIWRITGNTSRLDHFSLKIFDRWGNNVFSGNNRDNGWDGNYNGAPAAAGTYTYMVKYELKGSPVLQKGTLHLLR